MDNESKCLHLVGKIAQIFPLDIVFLKAHDHLLLETDMSADRYPFRHSIAAKWLRVIQVSCVNFTQEELKMVGIKFPANVFVFAEVNVVTIQLRLLCWRKLVFFYRFYNKKVVVVTVLNFLLEVRHDVCVYCSSVTTSFNLFWRKMGKEAFSFRQAISTWLVLNCVLPSLGQGQFC